MDTVDLKARLNNCSVPQYTRVSDLRPGIPYRITNLSRSRTRCGETICATLEGLLGDDVYLNVYLPSRFLKVLDDTTMDNYNKSNNEKMSLLYRGFGKGVEFV